MVSTLESWEQLLPGEHRPGGPRARLTIGAAGIRDLRRRRSAVRPPGPHAVEDRRSASESHPPEIAPRVWYPNVVPISTIAVGNRRSTKGKAPHMQGFWGRERRDSNPRPPA